MTYYVVISRTTC